MALSESLATLFVLEANNHASLKFLVADGHVGECLVDRSVFRSS